MDDLQRSVILLFSIYLANKLKKSHSILKETIENLKKSQIHTPSSLYSNINLLSELKNQILINGIAMSLIPNNDLILQGIVFSNSINGIVNPIEILCKKPISIKIDERFLLKDFETSQNCLLKIEEDIEILNCWRIIRILRVTNVGRFGNKIKKFFNIIYNIWLFFQGHSVDVDFIFQNNADITAEIGIQNNEPMLLFGKAMLNKLTNQIEIKPSYMISDKSTFLNFLIRKLWKKKIILKFVLFIAFYFFFKLGEKLYKFLRIKAKNIFDKFSLKKYQLLSLKLLKMGVPDIWKCVLCYNKNRSLLIKPCNHFGLCFNCYQKMTRKICPFCKIIIADVVEIVPMEIIDKSYNY